MNLTACVIAVIGASILTKSPLNVIQVLPLGLFRDPGFGFRVSGFGFRVSGLFKRKSAVQVIQVMGLRLFRISGFGFRGYLKGVI